MGEIYTDLNSDFPLKVSTMNRVQNVTLSAKPYVDLYNQYYSQGDFDNANKVINDHPELLTMMLNMNLVNQIIDEIKATQRTFKDDVESYIFTIVKIKGTFSKSTKYTKYNIVYFENLPYMAIADDIPIGTLPTNLTYWYPLAIKGEQGESGLGLSPRGAWNDSTQYYKDDMVAYNNILWAALADNINYIPNESSSMWLKLLSFSSEYLTYDNTQSELVATTLQSAIDEVCSKVKLKQDNLGYTPVQQGTGTGQLTNTVKIGWSSSNRLKASVDDTDLGNIVFDGNLPSSLPANGGNADTVDGTHAWQMQTLADSGTTHGTSHILTCQYSNSEGAFRFKTTDGISVRTNYSDTAGNANYSNSAGNSDTVDGYHVDLGTNNTYGLRPIAMGTFDLAAGSTVMTPGFIYIMYE